MRRTVCRLEIIHPSRWWDKCESGDRIVALESMVYKGIGYGGATVACVMESQVEVPVPAALGQVRRAPSGLSFTCIGIDDDCVWLKSVFQRIQRTKVVFESWELVES